MISFKKLGNYGRLGNQLFQYAFLRTTAKRLGVTFFCPPWIGDTIFTLGDASEKGKECDLSYTYVDEVHGFDTKALSIKDDTDISGFFQSDKYFSKEDVLEWFSFNHSVFAEVEEKYKDIDFSSATGMHIRLGDYADSQLVFYTPRPEYYKKALDYINCQGSVLVFSDDVVLAKKYLKNIKQDLIFIQGNKDYEDFYLLSHCKNVVCSSSTFSWWGAYLNTYGDKKIIIPEYWFLPGGKVSNNDIFVKGWIKIQAHRWYDFYYIKYIPNLCKVIGKRLRKVIAIIKHQGVRGLYQEFKKYFN